VDYGKVSEIACEADFTLTYLHRDVFSDAQKNEMMDARDTLGPKECTPNKPEKVAGNLQGGTRFKCSERAHPVKPGTRAYTIGPSTQIQPNLTSPVSTSKIYHNNVDRDLEIRNKLCKVCKCICHVYRDVSLKEILQAGASCAMTSLGYGPTEASHMLKMQADMINCP
jgi:hypothetical protein